MGGKRKITLVYINSTLSRRKANSCLGKRRKEVSAQEREKVTQEQLLPLIFSRRIKTHVSAFPLQAGRDGTELLGAVNAALG